MSTNLWQMRDISNEALRTLYVACKRNSGFPGKMPVRSDSNDSVISTHAILQGLGLITTEAENGISYNDEGVDQYSECAFCELHHRSKS